MTALYIDASYEGRFTVPVLWDKHTQTMVTNESSEIIRMFNSAFNDLSSNTTDYYASRLMMNTSGSAQDFTVPHGREVGGPS